MGSHLPVPKYSRFVRLVHQRVIVKRSFYRNCFLQSPFGAAKTSLKQQVVCEMRVAKTCPCKVNTFLLLEFEVEAIFGTVAKANAAVYTDILHLSGSKFT